jgi:Major Facilitator Superfamily
MAPLAFYARRFEPGSFATVPDIQLGLGTMGTVAATGPVGPVGQHPRVTFVLIAAAVAVAGLLVLMVLPGDRTVTDAARRETLRENLAGTWEALWTPSVFRLFLMQLAAYSGFLVIVGLWGGPYLTHVYGHGLTERGDLLFLAAGGQSVALMLNGPLERWFGNHKTPVLIGSAMTAGCLLLLAAAGALPRSFLIVWLLVFGLVSGYTPILIAHGTRLFPPHLLGRGMTLLNIGTMVGVFLSQVITGAIINLFPVSAEGAYPLNAYRLVFALQAAFLVVAIVPYLSAHDPHSRSNGPKSIT